jgi:hypothetical protein
VTYFIYQSNSWLFVTVILLVLALAIEIPYRVFKGYFSGNKEKTDPLNALQAGILTLSAFVLSLSFSQAQARFDARRALVTTEANAIGTTWLRADSLGPAQAPRFRQVLTDDISARLAAYGAPRNPQLYQQSIDRSTRDQDELWTIASSALQAHETFGLSQLRQSVNDTIDVAAQQRQSIASKVPTQVTTLTLLLVILGAMSLGVRFALDGSRPTLMSAIYVAAYVVVISMMVDYDRQDTGLIKVSLTPLTLQLQSMEHSP